MKKKRAVESFIQRAVEDAVDSGHLTLNAGSHVLGKKLGESLCLHLVYHMQLLKIVHLALGRQKLGWKVVGKLSSLCLKCDWPLRSLDLSFNSLMPLQDEKKIVEESAVYLHNLILRKRSLIAIDLSGNNLYIHCGDSLNMNWYVSCLSGNSHLQIVRTTEILTDQQTNLRLGNALMRSTKSKIGSYTCSKFQISKKLVELNISVTRSTVPSLNSEDVVLLCGILRSHQCITSLHLCNQSIRLAGASALAKLIIKSSTLSELNLSGAFLGDAGLAKLVEGVLGSGRNSQQFQYLNISKSRGVTEVGLSSFASRLLESAVSSVMFCPLKYLETHTLRVTEDVTELTFREKNRTCDVLLAFGLLCFNDSVKALDISGWSCELPSREPEVLRALITMLKVNTILHALNVSFTFLDRNYAPSLLDFFHNNLSRVAQLKVAQYCFQESKRWESALTSQSMEVSMRVRERKCFALCVRQLGLDCLLPQEMFLHIFEFAAERKEILYIEKNRLDRTK